MKESDVTPTRQWARFSNLKDLSLSYEGRNEIIAVHPPDISPAGMFINTSANFPEGAVLKVRFLLAKTNHPIEVRCEVRYCLQGVGVGVEFLDLPPRDQKAIKTEISVPAKKRPRRKSKSRK
jgi:hypothetical protein